MQAITQAPIAVLGTLFATPGGATTALKVARMLGRNFPLVLLLVMIGALFNRESVHAPEQNLSRSMLQRLTRG